MRGGAGPRRAACSTVTGAEHDADVTGDRGAISSQRVRPGRLRVLRGRVPRKVRRGSPTRARIRLEEYAPQPGEPMQPDLDGPGQEDDYEAPRAERPSQSREQMLRARRRMLTILVGMTFATMAFTAPGPVVDLRPAGACWSSTSCCSARSPWPTPSWPASGPPGKHARRALRAPPGGVPTRSVRGEPGPAGADAEIIDISGRVDADELYDQYADAAVRAVGD